MTVYRPKGSPYFHYDFVRRGRRCYGSTGLVSKRDAERYEADRKREAAIGTIAKPPITTDDAAGIWWKGIGEQQKSCATSRYQLAALVAGLGKSTPLADISMAELDRYVAKRRNGRANASVNREVELARRVFRYAADRGFDVPVIAWGKLLLKEPKERVRELSEDEERRLFEQLPADIAAVAEFALLSGQRRTSIVTMLWSNVDLSAGRAKVRVKGGHWHSFPLTPQMVAIIANRPKVAPQVFTYECERPAPARGDRVARRAGERYPFSNQGWMRKWRKALADAGIEDFRFHDLRHTRGTRMLRATGNLKAVQKLLGHADIATTARYAHALEDDVRAAMLAGEIAEESRNSTGKNNATPINKAKSGG